jgi:hypothetical protein
MKSIKSIKTLAVAALLTIAWTAAAMAQFMPTPAPKAFRPTYQASIVNLQVQIATTTDFFTIQGSATKLVTVTEMSCIGSVLTTATNPDVLIIKRSTANLTGTSTSPTGVPVDSSSAAATAVVKAYTVNPGTLGTAVGTIRAVKFPLPVLPTANLLLVRWQFGDSPFEQPVTLRGVAQTLAISGNGVALGGANQVSMSCNVTWTES